MMILRSTGASPFVRKVRIAMSLLGLADKIEVRETDLNDPADLIRVQNPLGKIPALILDDGTVYYDSRVIVEYLDHLAGGGRIVPREAKARFEALRLQALCDGLLEASLLIVYENRYRPADKHVQAWLDRQADKVTRGMAVLEAAPPPLTAVPDIGQIALACLLGYRDLRFGGTWRKDYPRLLAWHDRFAAQVPSFAATKFQA
ncbi:MAG: glutathione S-transferase family protein [Rhizobiales bacterium]|nr:glutathione S-transferase family protein [Hyphomicrobiales bacterium]